jgi:hypothetical protein
MCDTSSSDETCSRVMIMSLDVQYVITISGQLSRVNVTHKRDTGIINLLQLLLLVERKLNMPPA